jgi:cellulose synthase/poly-beta-1,6-N-acetylglucosamine synthase-like glycosyltransferase
MELITSLVIYPFMFVAVYFQVFLLLTIFEHHEAKKKNERHGTKLAHPYHFPWQTKHPRHPRDIQIDPNRQYPTVTILVPVWNEEKTVEKTVLSLLDLEYPKDKLNITIVDDGSTDNTWQFIQKFKDNPQITLHQKENGGKYTALNYGIEHSTSEFIGCLDADSFVDSKALLHIIPYFDDAKIAAVTPSMKIQNPDSILGLMQNAEYNMGIFTRKVFSLLDAQYVTPGPFSIFRKTVFKDVGLYRHAHNTEDLEMALRLQEKHYRITNADKAIVYTMGPRTLYKLYKQRVRWTGGFIQNALDYKKMILNPKYGNLGLLILPISMYAIVCSLLILCTSLYRTLRSLINFYEQYRLVGWTPGTINFEWISYQLKTPLIVGTVMVSLVIFAIWYGKHLAGVKDKKVIDVAYFLLLYSLISPLWLITSVYNTIRKRDAAWR